MSISNSLTDFEAAMVARLQMIANGPGTGVESVQLHLVRAVIESAEYVHPELETAYQAALARHLPALADVA